jgi:hypothetical protein
VPSTVLQAFGASQSRQLSQCWAAFGVDRYATADCGILLANAGDVIMPRTVAAPIPRVAPCSRQRREISGEQICVASLMASSQISCSNNTQVGFAVALLDVDQTLSEAEQLSGLFVRRPRKTCWCPKCSPRATAPVENSCRNSIILPRGQHLIWINSLIRVQCHLI